MIQTVCHRLRLVKIVVHKITELFRERVSRVNRAVTKGCQYVKIAFDAVLCRLHVVDRLVDQVMQLVDRVPEGFRLIDLDEGLHLADNAADILAPIHSAVIGAKRHHPGLPPDDTTDIVSGMLVSDRPRVGTPDDHAVRKSRDAACVNTTVQLAVIPACEALKDSSARSHLVILLDPLTVVIDSGAVRAVI